MLGLSSQKASCGCGKGPGEKGAVLAFYAVLGVASTLLSERNKAPKIQMSMNCLYEVTPANFSAILLLSLLLYSAPLHFFWKP